jgi:hypothetical protein
LLKIVPVLIVEREPAISPEVYVTLGHCLIENLIVQLLIVLYTIAKLLKGQAVEGFIEVPGIPGSPGRLDFYALARQGFRSRFSRGRF